jgi:hypothetical protein
VDRIHPAFVIPSAFFWREESAFVLLSKIALATGLLATALPAQDILSKRPAHVTIEPVATTTLRGSKPAKAMVRFKVRDGFHINSSKPTSELLIPTVLNVTDIPDVKAGKPAYPPGDDFAFAFAPKEKLNVYSGSVAIEVPLTAAKPVKPGQYALSGELKYQACDDRACYPPKTVPLEIPVRIEAK